MAHGVRAAVAGAVVLGESDEVAGRSVLQQERRARAGQDPSRSGDDSLRDLCQAVRACELASELEQRGRASASRRCASYRRAFSSATEAWPASTSSSRRSSPSNWSRPSLEMTMTPVTLEPNVSGTASSDSSISAVPAICSPNSQLAASPTRSGSPVSATRPVMPRPTFVGCTHAHPRVGGCQVAAERDRVEVVAVTQEHAAVVVVDEEAQLVRDRQPDLGDVVQPGELPDRLCSIFRCAIERTSSNGRRRRAARVSRRRRRRARPPRDFAVIIAASAQATSSAGSPRARGRPRSRSRR